MMGTKLRVALCALLPLLLLTDLGSAEQDVAEVDTKAPAPDSVPASSPESTTHPALALNGSDTNPSSNSTSSLRSNTTTDRNATSQIPISQRDNDTSVVSPSVSVVPENSANVTERSTSQPQILPSESNANITHILSTTNATKATKATNATRPPRPPPPHTGPLHTAHGVHVDTVTTNTSNVPASLPTDPISSSKHSTTHSFTFAPTPEPPKPDITAATNTSTRTSSTASPTISSQKPPKSESETLTTPQTSHSEGPQDQPKATVTTPSNPSVQAKAHADSPPQLKVGGDTTTIHESPTLDPLLAGLVSAFIITAVIITLLLFLKLRRRDNRPEFRRLQDLPMDDMMEDTPLSMYSY